MDHGPIVAQKKIAVSDWPPYANNLEKTLAKASGELLTEILPGWTEKKVKETPQDDSLATFTKKITKSDAEIDLAENPEINLRKIRAYAGEINTFTNFEVGKKKLRVLVKKARIENAALILERVVPEGRKEMSYEEFKNGFLKSKK